ncbi:MAG TPA: hypothetical protein VF735_01875 [Pyrinomonadaceae bacterium]|jgi:hypothetical protein
MKQSPRSNVLTTLALFALIALAPVAALAQKERGSRTAQRGNSKPTAETKDADRARRRQEAVNLLRETADRARSFDDLFYRSHIQLLAADALWKHDQQQARVIFRRAWEAATASDKAAQEELERREGPSSEAAKGFVMDARHEVILKAAARDPSMAEAFLKDYWKERKERETTQSPQPPRTLWGQLSEADAERLGLAQDLLARGESNGAAQLAAPLISRGVRADIITFIIHLREQSVAASDRLYAQLLAQARADASADANSVLLLSSPVISPDMLVQVSEDGSLQLRPLPPPKRAERSEAPPLISGALRNTFYQTAADLLLRPRAASGAGGVQRQQLVALYLATGRLLPFFEREAPQYAPELRAREQALAGDIEQSRRDLLASHLDTEREASEHAGDPLRSWLEKLERAAADTQRNDTERDALRLGMVRVAVRNRLWDRARRAAADIAKTESRRAALTFIAVSQIADLAHTYADPKETDYESIVKFLNGADVPPLASVWGYAEAARVAARSSESSAAALSLLNEAEREAGRVEPRTRQRVAAYVIVADAATRLDKQRAWTLLYEAVKAANAVEDFAGDEVSIDITATEGSTEDDPDYFVITSEAFRLDKIFATMAQLDWTKALADARALEGRVPQAFVHIAIARAALEKQG